MDYRNENGELVATIGFAGKHCATLRIYDAAFQKLVAKSADFGTMTKDFACFSFADTLLEMEKLGGYLAIFSDEDDCEINPRDWLAENCADCFLALMRGRWGCEYHEHYKHLEICIAHY